MIDDLAANSTFSKFSSASGNFAGKEKPFLSNASGLPHIKHMDLLFS